MHLERDDVFHVVCVSLCVWPDGSLMFQQVPLVEIDGLQLVQTRAIMNYIAGKYNLNGKDLQERVR